jgi:hypothetical protein
LIKSQAKGDAMKLTPPAAARWLSCLLKIVGFGLMLAFAFVLLPKSFLESIHSWLGLGDFPGQPVAEYLARSTSLLYGVHGVVMIGLSANVLKYIELVRLVGYLHIGIGLIMLVIDLMSSMPWWWTALEGIPVALTGALICWLQTQAAGINSAEVDR